MKKMPIVFALLCSILACKKNDCPVTATAPDVYVAGFEYDDSNREIAKYWKNGVSVALSDGTKNAIANGITIKGNDVYASGYEFAANSIFTRAVYWKNGVATYLTAGNSADWASGIVVDDMNNVYVVGGENNTAKYWKNGVAVNLPSTDGIAQPTGAYAITLDGSDVYVAGFVDNKAVFWKNGVVTALPGGNIARAIAVKGNDVYTVGMDASGNNRVAKYWKNTTGTNLTDGTVYAEAFDIALSANDIYIAFNENFTTKIWKNGVVNNVAGDKDKFLTGQSSIAIYNNDVYVAGSQGSNTPDKTGVARYWKNTKPVTLTDSTHEAFGLKIVVQ